MPKTTLTVEFEISTDDPLYQLRQLVRAEAWRLSVERHLAAEMRILALSAALGGDLDIQARITGLDDEAGQPIWPGGA